MPRESKETRAKRARRIAKALFRAHPDAHCALRHENAYQLLAATILSAQCTDAVVNTVTPVLFRRYPDPARLADSDPRELEQLIRPTGFYRNKTKSLRAMAQSVVADHGGQIPKTMEELTSLTGVGRKTANVILGNAFGVPGIVVDTHVSRLARRMELTREADPVKIERDLMNLLPESDWTQFSHTMIFHGRRTCAARNPQCEICPIEPDCPSPRRRAVKPRPAGKRGAGRRS
jgi:endonuclease-3